MKRWILAVAGAAALAACGEVALKRALPDHIQKLSIPAVENKTAQPGVDQLLSQKITQGFIVDGRLRVVGPEEADVLLKATLQRYDRIVLTRDASQVPQQYKLQIFVDLDFVDAKTGAQMWTTRRTIDLTPQADPDNEGAEWDSTNTRSLREFTTYYVINSVGVPPEDESVAAERVLDQMARRVVRRVIEGF